MQNVVLPFPSSSPSFFRWLRWLRPGQRLSGQRGEFKEAPASRCLHPAAAGGPGPCVWTSFLPWCLPHFRTHQTWTGWPYRFLSTHWHLQPCTDLLVSFFSFSCSKIIYIDFVLHFRENKLVHILTQVTKSSKQLLAQSNLQAFSLLQQITFIYIH